MTFIDHHIQPEDLHLQCSDLLQLLQVTDLSPDNPVVYEATTLFGQLTELADIHGGYIVYDDINIDKQEGVIRISDKQIHPQTQICRYMKDADKIAVFVCTAGEGFTESSRNYNKKGDYLKGFITDTLGSLVVESAMDLIQEKIENAFSNTELLITNRYSPGYCKWSVSDQQQLFTLLPEKPCDIRLLESCLMVPIKSVSGIIGIGKKVKKRGYSCSICSNRTCIYRNVKKHN
ncbi:MAG: vitamin B12 dependent-methionine synthase activation domain-containing protein [Proteiniphilum sp.]